VVSGIRSLDPEIEEGANDFKCGEGEEDIGIRGN
jgi:hypothetical protein